MWTVSLHYVLVIIIPICLSLSKCYVTCMYIEGYVYIKRVLGRRDKCCTYKQRFFYLGKIGQGIKRVSLLNSALIAEWFSVLPLRVRVANHYSGFESQLMRLSSILVLDSTHARTHTYTNTYIHTYIHTYISTNIHAYIHTLHTYMHTYSTYIQYIHTYIYTYIHTYMHAYIRTCVQTYIHTCIYAYIHTHTYIHTFTVHSFSCTR